jgi:hypothetical protein
VHSVSGVVRRLLSGAKPPSTHDQIRAHYDSVFEKDRIDEVHWTPGPMTSRLPDFHIVKVRPDRPEGLWTYATIGAWAATRDEPASLEFVAVARSEAAVIMERLAHAAYYHAGPPTNRLGVGHTVPIGEGWVPGSPLDHILVSLPYLWGPKLEHCPVSDRHVQVVWLLPIHKIERDFKQRHGVEALEQKLEAAAIDYLDPFRPPVVSVDEA